jgi:UDP-glucose 4-epimerase
MIRFAALIVVRDWVRDPLAQYRHYALNTCSLLELAIEYNARQVIFSSIEADAKPAPG